MKTLRAFLCLLLLASIHSHSQTYISGVINSYYDVIGIDYEDNSIVTSDSLNYGAGDRFLLIQMQGATINETNTSSFGTITDYGNAGNYEIVEVCEIVGNEVYFKEEFMNTYNTIGEIQLVSIPYFHDDQVILDGDLTPETWNGNTGGVLIFKCENELLLNGYNIDASGMGFRGGEAQDSGEDCLFVNDESYYQNINNENTKGAKAEGIAKIISGKEAGRGAQANGGGGGNNHNAGGSGGGNYGEGGSGGQRVKQSLFVCGSEIGVPSKDLEDGFAQGRIFMGGGGGAGHGNNDGLISESGTNGGGIIIIQCQAINGGGGFIFCHGLTNELPTENEGGGGGGAGGTLILDIEEYLTVLQVYVNGGNGTNTENFGESNCNGPGGGGSGGFIGISADEVPVFLQYSYSGGIAGEILSTQQDNCLVGSTNGASNGEDGTISTGFVLNSSPNLSEHCFPCANTEFNLEIISNGEELISAQDSASYQWFLCDGELEQLDGEIENTIAAEDGQLYAVSVTIGECSDTSSCELFTNVLELEREFDLYPNPFSESISISGLDVIEVSVFDIRGKQQLIQIEKQANDTLIHCKSLEPGAYIIRIITPQGLVSRRIIKN